MPQRAPFRTLSLLLPLLVLAACAPVRPAPTSVPAPSNPTVPAGPAAGEWRVPPLPTGRPVGREEYAQRRAALLQGVDRGVVVVLGNEEPDADYLPFAQNAPFRYLTGITEPGAALVLSKRNGRVREQLFVLPRNPAREVWEGPRLGARGAEALTGIAARSVAELQPVLDSLLAPGGVLYMVSALGPDGSGSAWLRPDQQFARVVRERNPGVELRELDEAVFRLRAIKSPAELDLLRRAIYITVLAQRAAMRAVEPGMNEFEIQALIESTFRRYGAERPAFGSIVGSGPNATTLHYRNADRFMEATDMLVMDVGAGYRGYAADVTRTVPVDGTFSPEQRAVYEIVLAAQKAAEAQAGPGVSLAQLHATAARVVAEGLARLGLIESPEAVYDCGTADQPRECPQWRLFFMHGLGHGIGLDVHDPDPSYPDYGGAFRVGSAFTIEPGLYVRADALDFLPETPRNRALAARLRPAVQRYRNIGVRIEDDYFITPTGAERISEGAPREIAEIEALMASPAPATERRPDVVEWYRATAPR